MTASREDGARRVPPGIRRLDHVAIVIEDTNTALRYFEGRLGLRVVHSEDLSEPPVRLTYLDAGNAFIQLVEPLTPSSQIALFLAENGEGVHHVCFGVNDVADGLDALREQEFEQLPVGSGRGRPSGFAANGSPHGLRIECTQFCYRLDVEDTAGWLPG